MKVSDFLRLLFSISILIAGSGVFAVWSIIWLTRASYLHAVLCDCAVSLFVSLIFLLTYPFSGTVSPRVEYGPTGTLLRPQKRFEMIFGTGLTIGICAAALYLALYQFEIVDFGTSLTARRIIPAGSTAYVIIGVPILFRVAKYRDISHLRLDPHGFEVWEGQWNSFAHRPWDDVQEILDHPLKRKKPYNEVMVFVLPKRRSAKLVTDVMTSDSDTLREWVRFYWQHPEHRGELVDERGLRRLEEGKFTVG